MKNLLIVIIFVMSFISCTNEVEYESSENYLNHNALLSDVVEINPHFEVQNELNPDWTSNFNDTLFFKMVFGKLSTGEFTDMYLVDKGKPEKYLFDEVVERMTSGNMINQESYKSDSIQNKPVPNLSEIKEFVFTENWNFDERSLRFEKDVIGWSPVRVYYREDHYDKEDARHKMICWFRNTKDANTDSLIAKDYIYTVEFLHEFLTRKGLDKEKFLNFILEKVQSGDMKSYDPIWLVDKSKREFTVKELQNYAGISFDPDEFIDEVYKLLFVEDWYFDNETFSIKKEVNALAFVANRKIADEWQDKILFFIFFD